jgi:hypothetical protein
MGKPVISTILILAKTQGARASYYPNRRRGFTQRRKGATKSDLRCAFASLREAFFAFDFGTPPKIHAGMTAF